eukprot:CAMPEP_0177432838 /NCGR_PEP_ID=MMETSP0368-20130122/76897_1 /TAXON_ID=447022 ORGANISM="Scrippsiella hangoei-like, Strain SHHI-4" /NCGR_SAMPLE_ID=MMETSP0368 /ASSEMBLY_ACC=CAM_ASM_000363 /LENGTH=258 /DNA_ID=CAMNT_0018903513 /DNA_START=59 /DNA_END=835 /DNA_ORIENTATION=+
MGRSRSRSRSGGGADRSRFQKLVDERQQCRRDRDFDRADELRDQLRGMGVNIDDTGLTWRGPDGLEGNVHNGGQPGIARKDGDWDCPGCGKMVFASKSECFSCGEQKPRDGGRGGRGGKTTVLPVAAAATTAAAGAMRATIAARLHGTAGGARQRELSLAMEPEANVEVRRACRPNERTMLLGRRPARNHWGDPTSGELMSSFFFFFDLLFRTLPQKPRWHSTTTDLSQRHILAFPDSPAETTLAGLKQPSGMSYNIS